MSLAIALLAAGSSSRFGGGDKLMAPIAGAPLCLHAANAARKLPAMAHWAITSPDYPARACALEAGGWTIAVNENAHTGQASSIALAARLADGTRVDRLLILLADMPFITTGHLHAVVQAGETAVAAMSRCGPALLPPACFSRTAFPGLEKLTGDAGAKSVFKTLEPRSEIRMDASMAEDIDTVADWKAAMARGALIHG